MTKPTTPGIAELLDVYGVACIQAARKALALGLADNGPTDTYRAILSHVAGLERERDEALKNTELWLEREAWSFLRNVLNQGMSIQMDYQGGKYPSYEHLSARLDEAAMERRDQLDAAIAQRGGNDA